MIGPNSASYPVLGACRAAGVDYALGLAWCDAPDEAAADLIADEIDRRHGGCAVVSLVLTLGAALAGGLVRIPRWGSA